MYCCELGIANRYSTPAYPQGNRQAEASNMVIVNRLKKRLDDAKGRWVKELLHVLWAYRMTPRRSTGGTNFAMIYGAEAGIPLEANFPTLRTNSFTPSGNDELLGEPRSNRGKKRKSNDPFSVLPPETQARLRRQRKAEAISTRRFSAKESRGCCQRPILGKARAQVGRVILNYFGSRNRCVLFRRLR